MARTQFDEYENAYGDTVSHAIDFQSEPHEYFLLAKHRELLAIAGDDPRERILSVGCAAGISERLLVPMVAPAKVFAIEPSVPLAARAHVTLNGTVSAAGGQALPFADGTFDIVFATCVFHHIPKEDRPAVAAEMARVTRPGGIVAILEHNPVNPLTRKAVHDCPFDFDAVLLHAAESRGLLRAATSQEPKTNYVLFFPRMLAWLRPLERLLRRIPVGAQYVSYVRR